MFCCNKIQNNKAVDPRPGLNLALHLEKVLDKLAKTICKLSDLKTTQFNFASNHCIKERAL